MIFEKSLPPFENLKIASIPNRLAVLDAPTRPHSDAEHKVHALDGSFGVVEKDNNTYLPYVEYDETTGEKKLIALLVFEKDGSIMPQQELDLAYKAVIKPGRFRKKKDLKDVMSQGAIEHYWPQIDAQVNRNRGIAAAAGGAALSLAFVAFRLYRNRNS